MLGFANERRASFENINVGVHHHFVIFFLSVSVGIQFVAGWSFVSDIVKRSVVQGECIISILFESVRQVR